MNPSVKTAEKIKLGWKTKYRNVILDWIYK